jgi:hypothetical protein
MQEESQGGVRGGERSPFSGVGVSGPGLLRVLALLLALIHPSAWKGYSPKFACRILHRFPVRAARKASEARYAAYAKSTCCGAA